MTTYVSLATPLAPGGIGVLLVVGPGAQGLVERAFRPCRRPLDLAPGRIARGRLIDLSDETLDEVLVRALDPADGFGQEGYEIDGHGGIACGLGALALFESLGAIRVDAAELPLLAAPPGSPRATRAEARGLLPEARTLRAATLLLAQADGALEKALARASRLAEAGRRDDALAAVERLLATAEPTGALVHGVNAALLGAPNSGKSTLFNRLLDSERALADPEPGTTRDVVTGLAALGGVPVRLADTAGVRETDHPVEKIGVARSLERARWPGWRVVVVDALAGTGSVPGDLLGGLEGQGRIVAFVNKIDLAGRERAASVARGLPWPTVQGSALTGEGVDLLARELAGPARSVDPLGPAVFTPRQETHLARARELLASGDLRGARQSIQSALTGVGAPS